MSVVDLFAGPGGWDFGAAAVGLEPIGFEVDADACATRRAAGMRTVQTDLATYQLPDTTNLAGLIASPPCPAFSIAGNGEGTDWLPHLCEVAAGLAELDPAAPIEATLSLKPLKWVLRHRPRWVAWEQVPPILPLWKTCAHRLRSVGYSVWTGVLCAADYGVPQTRRRAILLASLDRDVTPPEPTHAKDPTPSLFGELKPWMSMAEALGWGVELAGPTVTGDSRLGGGGSPGRVKWFDPMTGLDWKPGGTREDAQTRPSTEPAPTMTAKSGGQWRLGFARRNDLDQPAATIAFGNAHKDWQWIESRPATTIAGDPRVWPPGHKINQGDIDRLGLDEAERRYGKRSGDNGEGPSAIYLHPTEAALLQSFPAWYPFQGSKTSQFKQIGNAVPPLFAGHLLAAVTGAGLAETVTGGWWDMARDPLVLDYGGAS